jgi:hypothetical protein
MPKKVKEKIEDLKVTIKRVKMLDSKYALEYQKLESDLEKAQKESDKLATQIEKKLAPFKKELGIEKMETQLSKYSLQIEKIEEKKFRLLERVVDTMLDGAESKEFQLQQKYSPGGVSYKSMAQHLLAQVLGVEKNTKRFNEEFELLRKKFSSGLKYIYNLFFKNDIVHTRVSAEKDS